MTLAILLYQLQMEGVGATPEQDRPLVLGVGANLTADHQHTTLQRTHTVSGPIRKCWCFLAATPSVAYPSAAVATTHKKTRIRDKFAVRSGSFVGLAY